MKRRSFRHNLAVVALAAVVIGVVTFALLLISARTFPIYMKESPDGYTGATAEIKDPAVVEMVSAEKKGEHWVVTFRALQPGETEVDVAFTHSGEAYGDLKDYYHTYLYVTKVGTILESAKKDFHGFHILCGGLSVFFLFVGIYLLLQYRRRGKTDFFTYDTVLNLGLSGFFLLHGVLFLGLLLFCIVYPDEAIGRLLFLALEYAMTVIVLALLPAVLVLAGALAISNVWLIRHEGVRKTNLLALLLACLLVGGVGVCVIMGFVNTQLFAFDPASVAVSCARTAVSVVFVYFAAMLVATQYCCVIAARRKPPLTQDYILILGCAIKKDGTLYPLIKGRADKAIAFYRDQKEAAGTAPVLVPSGGQGGDEVIAEGEAVRRYLLSEGIPETDILAETASKNTLENMRCSKALIEAQKQDPSVIFSTTNYHVFRSGILAHDAGLKADGIASKTKWYFWPNAQIREFVGLLVRGWKRHLILLLLMLAFSLVFSNLGAIIDRLISM